MITLYGDHVIKLDSGPRIYYRHILITTEQSVIYCVHLKYFRVSILLLIKRINRAKTKRNYTGADPGFPVIEGADPSRRTPTIIFFPFSEKPYGIEENLVPRVGAPPSWTSHCYNWYIDREVRNIYPP